MTADGARANDAAAEREANRQEILRGLRARPKTLPCKLFYDARGSELFERICELDEYYLTRTELGILRAHASEMARLLGPGSTLVEFGSGLASKTRILLDALEAPAGYVPIDISESALLASARALRAAYPGLDVRPIWGDYTRELELPLATRSGRIVVFFPGSTLGNFPPPDALAFLKRIRSLAGDDGALVIGIDLKQDRATHEAAYNDRAGVTAQFNLNLLRVLNRDYGADFSLDAFRHRAEWRERESRIEMHLVSQRAQSVELQGERIAFEAGEPIVTEHCYKYTLDQFRGLAQRSGFEVERIWTDVRKRFGVELLRPSTTRVR